MLCREQRPPPMAIPDVYYITTDTNLTRNSTEGITTNDVTPKPGGEQSAGESCGGWGLFTRAHVMRTRGYKPRHKRLCW